MTGAIGFSGYKKDAPLFSKLIMFFTDSQWSHSFLTFFPANNTETVIEAGHSVQVTPFARYRGDPNRTYEIYALNGIEKKASDAALDYIFHEYSGAVYGFLQIPWFGYRWFWRQVGRDVGREANWFPSGKICSELVWDYETTVAGNFEKLLANSPITENTCSPEDLYRIVKANQDLLILIESNT